MQNLNYLFNKEYYKNLGTDEFKTDVIRINKYIEDIIFLQSDYNRYGNLLNETDVLYMKIKYPGVIIVMGNMHGTGKDFDGDEEIKNGFSFDYTTGQPYIPGSSVKGMLRSYFKEQRNAVAEILKAITEKEWTEEEIKTLEDDIFVNHDVFFDAVIYWGDEYGNILSMDFITPHKSPVKNPIPIRILKINPGVKLEFRFKLYDHSVGNKCIDKNKLLELFEELRQLFGVGAKTNVGYGIMEITDNTRPAYSKRAQEAAAQNTYPCSNNNPANRNNGGNYGGNRSNRDNRNNRPEPAQTHYGPVKIVCPHCKGLTYKFQQGGKTLNTECKKCRKPLSLS